MCLAAVGSASQLHSCTHRRCWTSCLLTPSLTHNINQYIIANTFIFAHLAGKMMCCLTAEYLCLASEMAGQPLLAPKLSLAENFIHEVPALILCSVSQLALLPPDPLQNPTWVLAWNEFCFFKPSSKKLGINFVRHSWWFPSLLMCRANEVLLHKVMKSSCFLPVN